MGRAGGVVSQGPTPAENTPRFAHSGMYFATGSSSAIKPSSTRVNSATQATGLVIE